MALALSKPVGEMTAEELMAAYGAIQWLEKYVKEARERLNSALKPIADGYGTKDEKGHNHYTVAGHTATVEHRVDALPNDEKLRTLLAKHQVAAESVYDKVTVEVLNPSKLMALVELGHLKEADVKATHNETLALKFKGSKELQQQLKALEGSVTKALTEGSKS